MDLPTDPDAIYTQFERDAEAEHSGPGAPIDVDLDIGGYDALARVPGVILLGKTTDRFGRQWIAVAFDFLKNEPFLFRQVLVFDPKTGSMLEERPGKSSRATAFEICPLAWSSLRSTRQPVTKS